MYALNYMPSQMCRIGYNDMVETLRSDQMFNVMKPLVSRMRQYCVSLHPTSSPAKLRFPRWSKLFQVSYLIVNHRDKVFLQIADLEKELIAASEALVAAFETLVEKIKVNGSLAPASESSLQFPTLVSNFCEKFATWKKIDEVVILDDLKAKLKTIYVHRNAHAVGSAVYKACEDAIKKHEERIIAVKGPDGKKEIEDWVKDNAAIVQGSQISTKLNMTPLIPDATVRVSPSIIHTTPVTPAVPKKRGSEVNNAPPAKRPNTTQTALANDSDIRVIRNYNKLSSEQLAHEIILDPNFQFNTDGSCRYTDPRTLADTKKAIEIFFHDVQHEYLQHPPSYAITMKTLSHLKDDLLDLAKETGMSVALLPTLDLDVQLLQLQEHDTLFFVDRTVDTVIIQRFIDLLLNLSSTTHKPVFQKELDLVLKTPDTPANKHVLLVDILKFCIKSVMTIRIEAANTRVRTVYRLLGAEGVKYEINKFNEKLTQQTLTLEKTTVLLFF